MDHLDYRKAAAHWQAADEKEVKMDAALLAAAVDRYIAAHNTCALATAREGLVRCTPIEYTYHDGAFWLFTEGGLKFDALEQNKQVCLAIFDPFEGFDRLGGMQVTGRAEILEPGCEEYDGAARFKHLQPDALKKLPFVMYLLKIVPTHIDFLSSKFKKQGFGTRQSLEFL